jgi:type I site-specific restriction endonuclease
MKFSWAMALGARTNKDELDNQLIPEILKFIRLKRPRHRKKGEKNGYDIYHHKRVRLAVVCAQRTEVNPISALTQKTLEKQSF